MPTNINGTTGVDKIQDGSVHDVDIDSVSASKLTGALPAIDGSALTGLSGGIPSQTGNAQKILTTDGTDASWLDNHEATLLFGTALAANTVGGTSTVNVTLTLAQDMNNFRGLIFSGSNWGNLHYVPVAFINNTAKMYSNAVTADGAQHMISSYDTYHYYFRRVSDTQLYITAGVGNGVIQIWGIK